MVGQRGCSQGFQEFTVTRVLVDVVLFVVQWTKVLVLRLDPGSLLVKVFVWSTRSTSTRTPGCDLDDESTQGPNPLEQKKSPSAGVEVESRVVYLIIYSLEPSVVPKGGRRSVYRYRPGWRGDSKFLLKVVRAKCLDTPPKPLYSWSPCCKPG